MNEDTILAAFWLIVGISVGRIVRLIGGVISWR